MANIEFASLDEAGYRTLPSWFDDPTLRKWYSPPTDTWFAYVQNTPGVHAWMIHENGTPFGFIQIDIHEDGVGYIGFYIKAEYRCRGYGKCMLRKMMSLPEMAQVNRIVAETDQDNIASIRCLLSVGFIQNGTLPDEHGFVQFSTDPH